MMSSAARARHRCLGAVIVCVGLGQLVAPDATADPRERMRGGIAADARLGDDISVWGGLRAEACRTISRFCIGGLVRVSADTRAKGGGSDFGTSRTGLDVLATVDAPLELGSVLIVPGLAVGPSLLYVRRRGFWGNESDTTSGLQLSAHTAIDVPMSPQTAFRFDVGIAQVLGARSEFASPNEDKAVLAGMPGQYLVVGIGLQYSWR